MAVDTLAKAQSAIRKYEVEVLGQVAKLSADIWADANRLKGLIERLDVSSKKSLWNWNTGRGEQKMDYLLRDTSESIVRNAGYCLDAFNALQSSHGIQKVAHNINNNVGQVSGIAQYAIKELMQFQRKIKPELRSGLQKSINMLLAYLYRIQKNAEKLQKLASML